MAQQTVFYSWQSDRQPSACRYFIQAALEEAVRALDASGTLEVEPVVDRDTLGVPGSPDISTTIFQKIDRASVFVADVSIVQRPHEGDPTPNPNVLVELGYAIRALDWSRIIQVMNVAYGKPEDLPFDLRQKRTLKYTSGDGAPRAEERRKLAKDLRDALNEVLKAHPIQRPPEVELLLTHKAVPERNHGQGRHFELEAAVKNNGNRRIDDWELELYFPAELVNPNIGNGAAVSNPSDPQVALFRIWDFDGKLKLRPHDKQGLTVSYLVDEARYKRVREGLPPVVLRVTIAGVLRDELTKTTPVDDLLQE